MVALGGMSACARGGRTGPTLALNAPLPTTVPPATGISITSYQGQQQLQLKLAGLADHLPFRVTSWPSLSAGPDVINAFRAGSLDVATNEWSPAEWCTAGPGEGRGVDE
jgi:sulfonate transport system substrate-binding protein